MPRRPDIAEALKAAGLLVVEHQGWTTRGAQDFDPLGVICHHTAGPAKGDAPSVPVCINGRPDLPGPLCHVVLARSGTCHVIAAGRANHAGLGAWQGVTGNRRFFGIEAENTGVGEPWPGVQVDAYVRACAALLKLINRDASWCAGHKEYAPKRKIDPAGLDMGWFRAQVAKHLRTPAPLPPSEDDDMAVIIRTDKGKPADPARPGSGEQYAVTDWVQRRGVASIDEVTRLATRLGDVVDIDRRDFDSIPVAK